MNKEKNENIKKCADLMASINPWKAFNYTENECYRKLSKPEIQLLIELDKQKTIKGFIAFSDTGVFLPTISYLCISKQYQRKGIGSNLLKRAENILLENNNNIILTVSDFNISAILFYLKAGYKEVGRLEDYNFYGQDELIFRKTLGPKREHTRQ